MAKSLNISVKGDNSNTYLKGFFVKINLVYIYYIIYICYYIYSLLRIEQWHTVFANIIIQYSSLFPFDNIVYFFYILSLSSFHVLKWLLAKRGSFFQISFVLSIYELPLCLVPPCAQWIRLASSAPRWKMKMRSRNMFCSAYLLLYQVGKYFR